MKTHGGKFILALTICLIVQHGIRHFVRADDKSSQTGGPASGIQLLDNQHPFPSLPPALSMSPEERTMVRVAVNVRQGQVLAISSLDHSIRQHKVSVKLQTRNPGEAVTRAERKAADLESSINVAHCKVSSEDSTLGSSQPPTIGWKLPRDNSKGDPQPHAADGQGADRRRRFQLPYFRGGQVYERPLILDRLGGNESVVVFGESTGLHRSTCDRLLAVDYRALLDVIGKWIGPINDVDGNGRLTFVLAQLADPIPDDDSRQPIRGCVRPADYRSDLSGSGDIVYLDPAHLEDSELPSLLAHELAHAATFSSLVNSGQTPTSMPGWLNEAIAHVIEREVDKSTANLVDRQLLFAKGMHLYPTVIPEQFSGMELRRGPSRIAALELLECLSEGKPSRSVRSLIDSRGDGIARLQRASGVSFETLFRNHTLRLFKQYVRPGLAARKPLSELAAGESTSSSRSPASSFQPAFELSVSGLDSGERGAFRLRGTAVAFSAPAVTDCIVTIHTTRAAALQVTVIGFND